MRKTITTAMILAVIVTSCHTTKGHKSLDGSIQPKVSEKIAYDYDSRQSDANLRMGVLNYANGDYVACEEYCNFALKSNPRNVAALYQRGMARLQQRKTNSGIEDIERVISKKSSYINHFVDQAERISDELKGEEAKLFDDKVFNLVMKTEYRPSPDQGAPLPIPKSESTLRLY